MQISTNQSALQGVAMCLFGSMDAAGSDQRFHRDHGRANTPGTSGLDPSRPARRTLERRSEHSVFEL